MILLFFSQLDTFMNLTLKLVHLTFRYNVYHLGMKCNIRKKTKLLLESSQLWLQEIAPCPGP